MANFQFNELFQKTFANRQCLITGHTGFKGSWLAIWLHQLGANLTGLALDPPTEPNLFEHANVASLLNDLRCDIRNEQQLNRAVADTQPEIIFHLAAQPIVRQSYTDPKETFDTNVGGTVNLLEAARDCDSVKAIVVVTSDKCYLLDKPGHAYTELDHLGGHDPYSASKAAAEIVTASYEKSFFTPKNIGMATARAGNVIGGGDWAADRILPDAVRALESDTAIPVRSPNAVRPWQHVLEPLSGYLLLAAKLFEHADAENPYKGAWNFGPNEEAHCTVEELIEQFIKTYGKGSWDDLSVAQKNAPHEAVWLALDCQKAKTNLSWQPMWNFQTAVEQTSSWYSSVADGANALDLCRKQIQHYTENND